ncbi:hypothetical protein, partial [Actinotalea ferrariae]|uniref:hypothetical protein n=1 Tax=Actinotalea ferrariae TaxID=1386098 RepID=UPI0012DF4CB2
MDFDVAGEYPGINEIALGRLCERLGVGSPGDVECELPSASELVQELVLHEWSTVADALIEELGDNFVFASLWWSRWSGVAFLSRVRLSG